MLKAPKTMDITCNPSKACSLKTTVPDQGTDQDVLAGEFDAVLAYIDKLKPQCETKVTSMEASAFLQKGLSEPG